MIRTQTLSSIYSADDPLSIAIRPPESESELQRLARLKEERDAKLISDRIDEELRLEKEKQKRRKNEVKLLLLGQAESGKSTLQKQFQLLYAPATLDEERASWRTVVYFNIVRTIKRMLETVDTVEAGSSGNEFEQEPEASGSSSALGTAPQKDRAMSAADTNDIARLRLRLSPLCSAESVLVELLSGGVQVGDGAKRRGGGVYVRSGWQKTGGKGKAAEMQGSYGAGYHAGDEDEKLDKIARILWNCKDDVKDLWKNRALRNLIDTRKVRLEESAEFFLDDIERVAAVGYVPSTDDILRARLQTMGIASHTFSLTIHGKALAWHLYDVGGSRGQRHTWIPYFDDANAIIFIAPVSAFDQYLDEDPHVNRINDSLQLFTQICSNELLKKVHLVLFLNKTDILKAKLRAGVLVKKYITSYAERPNKYESVIEYFRTHFSQVHRRNNDAGRVLYTHLTSVVDTAATQGIITNVRDSIFRGYLKEASLV